MSELGRAILLEATYRVFTYWACDMAPYEPYRETPDLEQRRRERWLHAVGRAEARYPDEEWSMDGHRFDYAIRALWR